MNRATKEVTWSPLPVRTITSLGREWSGWTEMLVGKRPEVFRRPVCCHLEKGGRPYCVPGEEGWLRSAPWEFCCFHVNPRLLFGTGLYTRVPREGTGAQ